MALLAATGYQVSVVGLPKIRCLRRCRCAAYSSHKVSHVGSSDTRTITLTARHASRAARTRKRPRTRTFALATAAAIATLVGCITPGRPPRAQRGRLCTQGATAGRACKGAEGRRTPNGCTLRSFQRQRRAAQTQRHSLGAAPAARAATRDALVTRRAARRRRGRFLSNHEHRAHARGDGPRGREVL